MVIQSYVAGDRFERKIVSKGASDSIKAVIFLNLCKQFTQTN